MINTQKTEERHQIAITITDSYTLTFDNWLESGSISECTILSLQKDGGDGVTEMFVIEPIKEGIWMLAIGGRDDAIFQRVGTFRECVEDATAQCKKLCSTS